MKTIKSLTIAAVLVFAFSFVSQAQMKFVKIKTSAQSELCKTTIEDHLKKENGVEEASLDLDSKVVTVKFSESETSYDNITKAITDLGYNADDHKACKDAYSKLPKGCKSECGDKPKTEVKSETSSSGCN